jgi:hypothetical protein
VAAIAVLLALPTETVLLKALTNPTPKAAAKQYVSSLTPDQLSAAASSIEAYPVVYRRAIMTALMPPVQAQVWQNHIAAYLAANPGMDPAAVSALQDAIALISPQLFTGPPTDAERAQIHAIAGEVTATLGQDVALNLLYNLGPADGTFVSAEPVTEKLADFVRKTFTLYADASSCDCNVGWGCEGGTYCASGTGCSVVTSWPACGWLWDDPCDGQCANGIGKDR